MIAVRIYVVTKRMLFGIIAILIALILLGLALALIFRSSPESAPTFERIESQSQTLAVEDDFSPTTSTVQKTD